MRLRLPPWHRRPDSPLGQAWGTLDEAFRKWLADDAFTLAAAISYYAVFSIAPLLILTVAVAALFIGRSGAEAGVLAQLKELTNSKGSHFFQAVFQGTGKQNSLGSSLVGVGVFLFGASGVFIQLTKALNRIWEVPPAHLSGIAPMIRQRFLSFLMVGVVGVLLLLSLVLSTSLSWAEHYLGTHHFALARALGGLPAVLTSLGLFTLLFALLFKALPEVDLAWRHVWIGGAVSAALFDAGRSVLGFYLGRTHFASLFGAAGSLTALMLWIFYGALIVLFGAEFTRAYTRRSRRAAGLPPDPPHRRKH